MIDFDKLSEKLGEALPAGLKDIKEDAKKNFKAVLESTFAKMNLVTREEFDAQTAVLARAREQIQMLEQQLHELEKTIKDK